MIWFELSSYWVRDATPTFAFSIEHQNSFFWAHLEYLSEKSNLVFTSKTDWGSHPNLRPACNRIYLIFHAAIPQLLKVSRTRWSRPTFAFPPFGGEKIQWQWTTSFKWTTRIYRHLRTTVSSSYFYFFKWHLLSGSIITCALRLLQSLIGSSKSCNFIVHSVVGLPIEE